MLPAALTLLQSMPIFGGLQAEALEQLLEDASHRAFAPGELLMVEDEAPGAVFILTRGTVEVVKQVNDQEYCFCQLGEGDCLGEMSWIDPCARSASVRALTPCEVICLEPRNFYRLRQKNLAQFSVLQLNIARELARRLRAVEARFLELLRSNATPR